MAITKERFVEIPETIDGGFVLAADHDALGTHEVLDRRAFAQKLGIIDDA